MIEWDEWVEVLSEHTRMGQKVQIGPETDLIEDLGVDSVGLIAILDEIEKEALILQNWMTFRNDSNVRKNVDGNQGTDRSQTI